MKSLKNIALLLLVVFSVNMLSGQVAEFKWPEDPELRSKAQEKYTYMSDLIRMDDYAKARPNFTWLLNNVPDLNVALYINGSKIYEGLEKKAKTDAEEKALQDTALWIYDQRIERYGDEPNVLNRKGLKAWYYLINRRPAPVEELYELYTKILELNGSEMYSSSLVALLDVACKMKQKGKIEDDKVIEIYEQANQILEPRLADGSKRETIYKERVDKEFMSCVKVDCDFVENKIAPKYRENPEDIKAAKKYVGMVGSVGCDKGDLYFQAAEKIVEKEPSPGGVVSFAKNAKTNGRWEKAIEYYNKALEMEALEPKKSEFYYEMADIYVRRGMKEKAKSYALKSIEAGSSHRAASYNLIGELYFNSAKDCDPKSVVLFRSRYIAAYEMFEKGGSTSGMSKSKAQFPSVNEMFQENYKVGDSFNTGCWMNEDVTLKSRD